MVLIGVIDFASFQGQAHSFTAISAEAESIATVWKGEQEERENLSHQTLQDIQTCTQCISIIFQIRRVCSVSSLSKELLKNENKFISPVNEQTITSSSSTIKIINFFNFQFLISPKIYCFSDFPRRRSYKADHYYFIEYCIIC